MTLIGAPFLVVQEMDSAAHAILPLILTGMAAGFVHGLGMRPVYWVWRAAFSPFVAWPLIVVGWLALLTTR